MTAAAAARDRDLAARALPFAALLATLETPGTPLPPGWRRAADRRAFGRARWLAAVLGDFRPVVFLNDGEGRAAVAIPGTRVNLRGILAVLRRRIFGGASQLAAAFVGLARRQFPGYALTVIGHSSGGGTASWLGGALGVATITFNGARTRAALRNGGSRQVNVIVRGDFWGDPTVLPGRLAGATLWLDGTGLGGPERHAMATIVRRLESLAGMAANGA